MDRAQQHVRGHALEHHRLPPARSDHLGQLHQPAGIDQPLLGIAADRPGISDTVAGFQVRDAGANASTIPAPSTPGVNGSGCG